MECSEGIATLFAAQGASVIFAIELVSSGKPCAQYFVRVPAPTDEYLHDDFTRLAINTSLIIEYLQTIRFFWEMYMVFYCASEWTTGRGSKDVVRDHITQQSNTLLNDWVGLWQRLIGKPDRQVIKQQLGYFMPKNRALITCQDQR